MILLGIECYRIYEEKIKAMKKSYTIAILGSGIAIEYGLYLIELYILKDKTMADDGALFIILPLLACMLVLFSSLFTIENNDSVLYRNLSTGMYLLHRPIISLYTITTLLFNFCLNEELNFLLTALISFGICIIAYKSNSKLGIFLK